MTFRVKEKFRLHPEDVDYLYIGSNFLQLDRGLREEVLVICQVSRL